MTSIRPGSWSVQALDIRQNRQKYVVREEYLQNEDDTTNETRSDQHGGKGGTQNGWQEKLDQMPIFNPHGRTGDVQ